MSPEILTTSRKASPAPRKEPQAVLTLGIGGARAGETGAEFGQRSWAARA